MTLTQANAITAVRDRLDEPSAAFYTEAQIRAWLNEGVREVARRSEWKRTSSSVTVTAGTQFYAAPSTAIRIYRVEYTPTGTSLKYTLEYRDLNAMDAIWGVNQSIGQGTPEFYTMASANPLSIELSPTPAQAGTIKVYYYDMPADLVTSTTTDAAVALSVPNGWEDLPVEWATALGFRKSRDTQSYQLAIAQFNQTIGELTDMATRYTDEATSMTPYTGAWGGGDPYGWY